MEIIKKENVTYTTVYKACDDTEFYSQEECEKYENSAKMVLRSRFNKLIVNDDYSEYSLFRAGEEDCKILAIRMTTQQERDTVVQFYYLMNPHLMEDNYLEFKERFDACVEKAFENKDILLFSQNYNKDIYVLDCKQSIIDRLMNIEKKEDISNG